MLADLGFKDVVSLNSVGSLKKDLPPGTFVSCSDYVGLQQGPATFFDAELKGGAPDGQQPDPAVDSQACPWN